MNENYYDNSDIIADENGRVFVDRIYCLDFHKFDDGLWNKLGDIYNLLPHKIDIDFPTWYGVEGESDSYLCASVEPSGLQISGELKANDWIQWECVFNSYLNIFPLLEV